MPLPSLSDINYQVQTPEERSQAGYADVDFAMGIGVPDWNPVAKVGYDPSALGVTPLNNDRLLGITAGFAPYGIKNLDTSAQSGEFAPQTADIINRTRDRYRETRPEFLEKDYPVTLNKKLMYLDDPKEFMKVLYAYDLDPKDYPHTTEGMRRLKKRVLEHEFTHRGNRYLEKGNYNSGAARDLEEITTAATTALYPEQSKRDPYDIESFAADLSEYEDPRAKLDQITERVRKFIKMAEDRLAEQGRKY